MAILNFLIPNSVCRVSNIRYNHREENVSFSLSIAVGETVFTAIEYRVSQGALYSKVIAMNVSEAPEDMEVGQKIHVTDVNVSDELARFIHVVAEKTEDGFAVHSPLVIKDLSSGLVYTRDAQNSAIWNLSSDPALTAWEEYFSIGEISQNNIVSQAYLYLLSRPEFAGASSDE